MTRATALILQQVIRMANLTPLEKRRLELILDMGSGYVLDFSNRTFVEFVEESTGQNIFDAKYDYASGSKANRLRAFWNLESDYLVARLIGDLLEYGKDTKTLKRPEEFLPRALNIVARLKNSSPVDDLDALTPTVEERDFETISAQVRQSIERNQPEAGLDRLHTYLTKYIRTLCEEFGIQTARDKPLHSLLGEYVKHMRNEGHIESEMTLRILKSSISILEAFNDVRNHQSLAHDNPILNYEESLLIFNHVASSVRFLRSLAAQAKKVTPPEEATSNLDDLPF